jgi:hypothetical protein
MPTSWLGPVVATSRAYESLIKPAQPGVAIWMEMQPGLLVRLIRADRQMHNKGCSLLNVADDFDFPSMLLNDAVTRR